MGWDTLTIAGVCSICNLICASWLSAHDACQYLPTYTYYIYASRRSVNTHLGYDRIENSMGALTAPNEHHTLRRTEGWS